MEVKGRLMLRGFFYWPMAEGQFFTYTDVTPFIRQIVTKSYDLFLMPEVPKVIQPIGKFVLILKLKIVSP